MRLIVVYAFDYTAFDFAFTIATGYVCVYVRTLPTLRCYVARFCTPLCLYVCFVPLLLHVLRCLRSRLVVVTRLIALHTVTAFYLRVTPVGLFDSFCYVVRAFDYVLPILRGYALLRTRLHTHVLTFATLPHCVGLLFVPQRFTLITTTPVHTFARSPHRFVRTRRVYRLRCCVWLLRTVLFPFCVTLPFVCALLRDYTHILYVCWIVRALHVCLRSGLITIAFVTAPFYVDALHVCCWLRCVTYDRVPVRCVTFVFTRTRLPLPHVYTLLRTPLDVVAFTFPRLRYVYWVRYYGWLPTLRFTAVVPHVLHSSALIWLRC